MSGQNILACGYILYEVVFSIAAVREIHNLPWNCYPVLLNIYPSLWATVLPPISVKNT
jgi:hypothetical protein